MGKPELETVAIISLNDVQLDRADNGKDQQLFELILCGCSAQEEQQWTSGLSGHAAQLNREDHQRNSMMCLLSFENSILSLDIKSLGPVYGLPGTLLRRQSIQRAATTSHRRQICQVIIKNTFSLKETSESPLKRSGTLSRSTSLMSTNHIPILAPKRGDRQRLEQRMIHAWTKDRLPYPGMTGHHGGHLLRRSTTSIMRKISSVNLTNPLSTERGRNAALEDVVESSPYSIPCGEQARNQTDGALCSSVENIQSCPNSFRSTVEYQDPNPYTKCAVLTQTQASIETTEHEEANENEEQDPRRVSEASTIVTRQISKDPVSEKRRPHKPKTLLKAFSTESIRAWFH
ncbi:hypothetical protein ACLMJK_008565 [Lecanora helva]